MRGDKLTLTQIVLMTLNLRLLTYITNKLIPIYQYIKYWEEVLDNIYCELVEKLVTHTNQELIELNPYYLDLNFVRKVRQAHTPCNSPNLNIWRVVKAIKEVLPTSNYTSSSYRTGEQWIKITDKKDQKVLPFKTPVSLQKEPLVISKGYSYWYRQTLLQLPVLTIISEPYLPQQMIYRGYSRIKLYKEGKCINTYTVLTNTLMLREECPLVDRLIKEIKETYT